jgi:uncharacterized protein
MSTPRKKILVFLGLTILFSSVFYFLIATSGRLAGYSMGLMWCPGVAALITQFIFNRNVKDLGWRAGKAKYLLIGYGVPILYGGVVYVIVWLTGLGLLQPEQMAVQMAAQYQIHMSSPGIFLSVYLLIAATLGLIMGGIMALGEEIGWRGLLVPELAKETTFTKTALISGGIWALWHLPIILFSDYNNAGVPVWYGIICFAILAMGISFAMAWLRLKSGSLWPAVILHAAHNLFIQAIFTPLTGNTGITPYIIDEFGIGLAITAVIAAFIFWRKRGEIPAAAVV